MLLNHIGYKNKSASVYGSVQQGAPSAQNTAHTFSLLGWELSDDT